jgi:hypothetical protein
MLHHANWRTGRSYISKRCQGREGLVDRTLRNGTKAGRFESPEQLYAEYLSTLTTDAQYPHKMKQNPRRKYESCRRRYGDRPTNNKLCRPMKRMSLRCYNCNKLGHHFSQCKRPITECDHVDGYTSTAQCSISDLSAKARHCLCWVSSDVPSLDSTYMLRYSHSVPLSYHSALSVYCSI